MKTKFQDKVAVITGSSRGIGKLNKFMQACFPMLVEKIILKNMHKFEEKSE